MRSCGTEIPDDVFAPTRERYVGEDAPDSKGRRSNKGKKRQTRYFCCREHSNEWLRDLVEGRGEFPGLTDRGTLEAGEERHETS